MSISIRRTALAKRPLGRSELRHLTNWNDGQPGTELNFKFYRQATNKVVRISADAAAFLGEFFWPATAALSTFPPSKKRANACSS